MRILIDLTSLADNFSGIERFAMSVAKELVENPRNSYILLFKNQVHPAFSQDWTNVEKVVLKGSNKLIFNQIVLPLALLRYSADRYLFLAFPAPFLFFSRKAVSAIHDLGCWDCPGANKSYMNLYFRILYRKAAACGKKIITVSEFSKKRIVDILRCDEKNISVVYNGLSDQLLTFEYDRQQDAVARTKYDLPETYLLCLSTLEPRKNLKLLLQAYEQLREEGRLEMPLVLAGRKGWMVDDLLAGLKAETVRNIRFTGFVDETDLPYVYRNAALFVFPSLYEGFGVPPIEAMSMGTLVVSSDAASLPEVLGDGAIYFENNSVEALKQAICRVITLDEIQRQELLARGKQTTAQYQWHKSAETLEQAIL